MKSLIENFHHQLEEAYAIGEAYKFRTKKRTFKNVLICGLGGSGIGGSFVKDATYNELKVPIVLVKGYLIPQFVNEDTLVIIASYSGNTEEALQCLRESINRNAIIVGVSSGGEVLRICAEQDFDCIQIPGGHPPRACFAYSSIQLFYILYYYDLISASFKKDVLASAELLAANQADIKKQAINLAEVLFDKIPVLYSSNHLESIAVRWCQQMNENGKQLCWHNTLPEMNHNELVGWRQKNENLAVVYLRNDDDYDKIRQRIELNKVVIEKYTSNVLEVWSKGSSFIEKSMYLVHLGDWISFYLADLRGFNVTEIKVINELKANLK
jgi:glucose/mannose-6-phosphate isomerase